MIAWIRRALFFGLVTVAGGAVERSDLPEEVTFSEHIAPIINDNCLVCHRTEGVGPFSFENYDQVKRRARQISEVVASRYMPPWKPDPEFTPPLIDERRLTSYEIELIQTWEKSGCLPGNLDELPEQPYFPKTWVLGKPDMVLTLEEAYLLPADGTDIYRNFVFPIPIEKVHYVQAVEFLPETQLAIHHATLHIDQTDTSRKLDEMEQEPGFDSMILATADLPDGQFVGWTPGQRPFESHPGTAWKWTPGSDLVLQVHMLPSGKPEKIAPKIGLHFADAPPSRITSVISLGVDTINIPPGENHYTVRSDITLPAEVEVLGVYPHAHYLGKDLKVYAELPNGVRQWLIRIPDWDFNWQMDYRYTGPIILPKGSTVVMDYTYDNSSGNIRNPSDPPKRVKQGYRSTDEMADVKIQVLLQSVEDLEQLDRVQLDYLDLPAGQTLLAFQLGLQLQKSGKLDAAIQAYQTALDNDPEFSPALTQLGMVLLETGEAEMGLDQFRKAFEADPETAEHLWNLARALFSTGSQEQASKLLYAFLDKEPERMDARLMLAMVYAENNLMRHSVNLLTEGLKWHEENPAYRLQLGKIRMTAGNVAQAQEDLSFVLKSDNSNYELEKSRAAYALAVIYQRAGKTDKVEAYLTKSIEHDGSYAPAYVLQATVHLIHGNTDDAKKALRHLTALDSKDRPSPAQLGKVLPTPNGVILMAEAYMEKGMAVDARTVLGTALEIAVNKSRSEHTQAIMGTINRFGL